MRRLVLLLAALAFGCDDPAVAAKAADVLEHGFISGELTCQCNYGSNEAFTIRAFRFVDGACWMDGALGSVTLYPRSHQDAAGCVLEHPRVDAFDGEDFQVSPAYVDPSAPYTIEASTCCTGFNFEAFGVE
jgi:hypothetical protein